ncbi:AP2-like ethylene-responsive transcription factor [Artemisia annua]|uniref:AP2-like ethylene-responsive transcription factor n=1 Tax=Artemisia annua TaxID=35608 RepID=A0A2U1P5Q7_ARTAN|nr:AP2-like ethylene-responsive transcription factor [Artemisia annua]
MNAVITTEIQSVTSSDVLNVIDDGDSVSYDANNKQTVNRIDILNKMCELKDEHELYRSDVNLITRQLFPVEAEEEKLGDRSITSYPISSDWLNLRVLEHQQHPYILW